MTRACTVADVQTPSGCASISHRSQRPSISIRQMVPGRNVTASTSRGEGFDSPASWTWCTRAEDIGKGV